MSMSESDAFRLITFLSYFNGMGARGGGGDFEYISFYWPGMAGVATAAGAAGGVSLPSLLINT